VVDARGLPPARATCTHASRTLVAAGALHRLTERAMAIPRARGSLPCTMTAERVPRACAGRPAGGPGGQTMLAITVVGPQGGRVVMASMRGGEPVYLLLSLGRRSRLACPRGEVGHRRPYGSPSIAF
jgi:hypothetical protein